METTCLYPRAHEIMLAFIISFVINNVEILCGSTYRDVCWESLIFQNTERESVWVLHRTVRFNNKAMVAICVVIFDV